MNIAALTAGLFSGIIGSMGLGGGAVLIIYLTLFSDTPQLKAQGINLLFFIPIAAAAVGIYAFKGAIKYKLTLKLALWGLLGTALGLLLTDLLGGELTSKLFGTLLTAVGLGEIFTKGRKTVAEKNK